MKKSTKGVLRVLISLAYIIWGILSPITALQAILALDIGAIVSAAVGIAMLIAGFLGLINVKKKTCRLLGVVLFLFSVVAVIVSLPGINYQSIITAVLAWLFIVCL